VPAPALDVRAVSARLDAVNVGADPPSLDIGRWPSGIPWSPSLSRPDEEFDTAKPGNPDKKSQ